MIHHRLHRGTRSRPNVSSGSDCEILRPSICFPVLLRKRNSLIARPSRATPPARRALPRSARTASLLDRARPGRGSATERGSTRSRPGCGVRRLRCS